MTPSEFIRSFFFFFIESQTQLPFDRLQNGSRTNGLPSVNRTYRQPVVVNSRRLFFLPTALRWCYTIDRGKIIENISKKPPLWILNEFTQCWDVITLYTYSYDLAWSSTRFYAGNISAQRYTRIYVAKIFFFIKHYFETLFFRII